MANKRKKRMKAGLLRAGRLAPFCEKLRILPPLNVCEPYATNVEQTIIGFNWQKWGGSACRHKARQLSRSPKAREIVPQEGAQPYSLSAARALRQRAWHD